MCLPTWTPHSSPPSRPTTIASFGSEPSAKWTKRKKERCAEAHSSRTLKGPHQQTPGERPPLWIRDDLVSVRFFLLGGGGTSSYYSVCIFFSLSLSLQQMSWTCLFYFGDWMVQKIAWQAFTVDRDGKCKLLTCKKLDNNNNQWVERRGKQTEQMPVHQLEQVGGFFVGGR